MNDTIQMTLRLFESAGIPAVVTVMFLGIVGLVFVWGKIKKTNIEGAVTSSQITNDQITQLSSTMKHLSTQLTESLEQNEMLFSENKVLIKENRELVKLNAELLDRIEKAEDRIDVLETQLEHTAKKQNRRVSDTPSKNNV